MTYHHILYCAIITSPILISSLAFIIYWAEFLHYVFLETDISDQIFDFIIVGGGSAGCVLANRLSEVSGWKVLLLEAGGTPSILSAVPVFAPTIQMSSYSWQTETKSQSSCCGSMVDKRSRWPSGKMLGGSSGLNYMLYVRGEGKDYDNWADEVGDPSWSYNSLLPYFARSLEVMPVSEEPHTSTISRDYMEMARDLGLDTNMDINSSRQASFQIPKVSQTDGWRGDTYRTYLRNAQGRDNLIVIKHAQVLRVLVENNRAVGVRYSRYGKEVEVKADKEVVLSAGTVGSARLLLLSGIGPSQHIRDLGIPFVHDLPVGRNLQDHLTTSLGPFMVNSSNLGFNPESLLSPQTYWDFLVHGKGPLSSVGVDAMAFLHSDLHHKDSIQESTMESSHESTQDSTRSFTRDSTQESIRKSTKDSRPDFQLLFMASWLMGDYWTLIWKTFGLDGPLLWEKYFRYLYHPKSMYAVSILPVILRPRSRGEVRLSCASPWVPPVVDPQYLSHPEDKTLLVTAIQKTLAMVNTSVHLQRHGYRIPEIHWPGCETYTLFSFSYWECYVEQMSLTMYHPVGTCRMGSPGKVTTVVDPTLKVQGVTRLRVVDASIMPTIVSGNTNAATVVIAEKGADMIKMDWTNNSEAETGNTEAVRKTRKEL